MAAQLLTRLPLPPLTRLDAEAARAALSRAVAWLPLAGASVGAVTAATFAAASLLWPPPVAAGIALTVEAVLTGAFHEDAVADVCDALGGSATGEEARRIMKDSRIGSYGALGLILLVGLRWASIAALPAAIAMAAIVAAATVGRLAAVILLRLTPPVPGEGGLAGGIGAPSDSTLSLALALSVPGCAALAIAAPGAMLAGVAVMLVAVAWFSRVVRRRLGGSTGDCLGFVACLAQVAVVLVVLAR